MQQELPKLNITLDKTVPVICEKCGSSTFTEALMLRRAPRLLTGAPTDSYLPIPVFCCTSCSHTNEEFLPREMKKIESEDE